MLNIIWEAKFTKEFKVAIKRGKDMGKLKKIIEDLQDNKPLAPKHQNHKLQGRYTGYWECHIEPDWLLVYKKTDTDLILGRTGTHSDLF